MKTAIEKPVTPSGVFDHLMVPQGDEPEFHPSKDPKTMTMQEFLEEVDRFLCWNRMTPEEKRAEQEAQRAASHATEQAAGDIPCTMRPERVPDTPQDTVWEDLTDAPQDVVRADMLDTSMDGMLEAVPSNGAPERAADTMLDDVPDATEGNVPGREADTVPDGPPDDLPDTVEGNMPDVVGALTAQEKAGNETVQGVPEVEVVPPEAIVLLEQTGEDVPAAEERWAYASELIGDAFQHWGNGRVLLDMGTGRGKSEFVIRKMAGWAVDQFLEGNCDNRILMLCPLTLLHEDLENRRREEYLHSDNPEAIQKKIDKSKILEHNVVTGYHINPLGLQQVEHDIEMLDDIMSSTNYPESFMKYAMFNLHQPIKAYRFKDLEDWLYAHLNQPMDSEEMTEKIMSFGYIERYQGREPGQMGLNKFLPCYGVKIVSDRENKRNENRNKTFWTLMKQ